MKPAKLVLLSSLAEKPQTINSESAIERGFITRELREIKKAFRVVLIIDNARHSPHAGDHVDSYKGVYWPGGLQTLAWVDRAVLRTNGFKERVLKDRGNV